MSKIVVHRKGYIRKGFVKHGRRVAPARVKPTKYLKTDIGKKGKGKPFIKPSAVKKNMLGEGFFDKSAKQQKTILASQTRKKGEKAVQGHLQFMANVRLHQKSPGAVQIKKRSKNLRTWVAKNFDGKKRASAPSNFSSDPNRPDPKQGAFTLLSFDMFGKAPSELNEEQYKQLVEKSEDENEYFPYLSLQEQSMSDAEIEQANRETEEEAARAGLNINKNRKLWRLIITQQDKDRWGGEI